MASKLKQNVEILEEVNEDSYELLAGYIDSEGVLHKTFTIREMTGRDEEAIQKVDKNNGSKMISTLLERCVTSIGSLTPDSVSQSDWSKIIKSLFIGDQDYILLQIRKESIGEEFIVNHECPSCHTSLTTYLSLEEIETIPFDGVREIEFTLPRGYKDKKKVLHSKGIMRIPNGIDREILTPIAKKNLAQGTTLMLTRLCTFEDGFPITNDVMADLTMKDREYLQKLLQDHIFGIKSEIPITCDSCGVEFMGSLNAANFI